MQLTREDDTPRPDPSGLNLVLEARATKDAPPAVSCTPIRRIDIRGVIFVDPEALHKKLSPVAVDCVGNDEVKAILAAINGHYAEQGYVTTQGYLPVQDIAASRTLTINIIAGRIDRIDYREIRGDEALEIPERVGKAWSAIVDAPGPWSRLSAVSGFIDRFDDALDDFQILPRDLTTSSKLWTSFVTASGEVVQIDHVQQGIDQINRVASSRAQVKLAPGNAPATSVLVVENNREDSFRVHAGYELNGADINGSGKTIPTRMRLDIAKDDLIGVNDAWRLSYAGGIDSNEIRGAFSVPFRWLTLAFDGGYSETLAEVVPGVELFTRDGNFSAAIEYLLLRESNRQISIDTSLSWRTGERFLNGASLTPQTVTQGRFGFTETRTFEALQLSYGGAINHGLSILGAKEDPQPITPSMPHAQFLKFDGHSSLIKAFATGMLRLDVTGQWSGHPLLSDDQLVLGSISTVRGFTNSAARTDRGIVVRAEFAPAIPVAMIMGSRKEEWVFLTEFLSGLQPYLFSDYGAGRDIANQQNLQRAGIGAGLRYRHGRISLDVSVGEPVHWAGGQKPTNWQSPEAYLTLSVKLL